MAGKKKSNKDYVGQTARTAANKVRKAEAYARHMAKAKARREKREMNKEVII